MHPSGAPAFGAPIGPSRDSGSGGGILAESTIISRGQTTVPPEIRNMLRALRQTRLDWFVLPDGTIPVRATPHFSVDKTCTVKARKSPKQERPASGLIGLQRLESGWDR